MSLVALVNTANHLFVRREPLIWTQEQLCQHVLGLALVNTANHLFVRREPLISTQITIVSTCPWSRWLTQQTTYLYAENHLFQHGRPTLILSSSHWRERCLALSLCEGRWDILYAKISRFKWRVNVGSLIIALRSGRYLQVQTSSKSSFWKRIGLLVWNIFVAS